MNSFPGQPPPEETIESMLRVNLAGEYGAKRIYEGQLAVLKTHPSAPVLEHMLEQETGHLKSFEAWAVKHRVRPTRLHPLWHVAGYTLGVATGLLGEKAAMACTVAIEEVIDQHYEKQLTRLGSHNPELSHLIYTCQQEEREHKDIALEQGRNYPILSSAIKAASRLAIWLSERV
jgi:ubiquinone biosynthesis monooxygenase Coq7